MKTGSAASVAANRQRIDRVRPLLKDALGELAGALALVPLVCGGAIAAACGRLILADGACALRGPDPTLLHQVDVFSGRRSNGYVLVSSVRSFGPPAAGRAAAGRARRCDGDRLCPSRSRLRSGPASRTRSATPTRRASMLRQLEGSTPTRSSSITARAAGSARRSARAA